MSRQDERGLRPTEADLVAAEAATRAMLASYDEPQLLAPPPDLAARVLAALPATVPAPQTRPGWYLRGAGAFAVALLVLAMGGWGFYASLLALSANGELFAELAPARNGLTASLAAILGQVSVDQPSALPAALIAGLISLATLAFSSAVAVVWPRRTRAVALTICQAPAWALGLGLIATLLVGLILGLLGTLAAFSPAWFALLLPLALLFQLPYLVGLAALGDALSRAVGLRLTTPASSTLGVGALLLLLTLLSSGAPLLSGGLFYLGAGVGFGAALLSRGGTYAPFC